MPDPATRRWAQSVATRPLKPFDFHNLKVDDAAKTKQVLQTTRWDPKEEKDVPLRPPLNMGNFTAKQEGKLQRLIHRDLEGAREQVGWFDGYGMAATGQILGVGQTLPNGQVLDEGEITYEHKLRDAAPRRDNADRTAYYGRQAKRGAKPFWGDLHDVSGDPTQNVHVGSDGKLFGPSPGIRAEDVDPPWLAVAQRTSGVAGKAKGRRDWDTADWAEKEHRPRRGRGRGRGGRGRGRGRGQRRAQPGSRARKREQIRERHPLTNTPQTQGARVGGRPVSCSSHISRAV